MRVMFKNGYEKIDNGDRWKRFVNVFEDDFKDFFRVESMIVMIGFVRFGENIEVKVWT